MDLERPFLERDHELAMLQHTMGAAAQGSGLARIVLGPAGAGRSRLLREAATLAAADGMAVVWCRGGELIQDAAFGLLSEMATALLDVFPTTRRQELIRDEAGLLSGVRRIGSCGRAALSAEDEFRLANELLGLISERCTASPLVVVVDDAHRSDTRSLRVLRYLMERCGELSASVLIGVRTTDSESYSGPVCGLWDSVSDETVKLGSLSCEAVTQMGASVLLDAHLAKALWWETGGNPYLVHAALADYSESGGNQDFGRPLPVPDVVKRNTLYRLSRIGEDAAELARAIAVLGGDGKQSLLAHLAQMSPTRALTGVRQLADAGLVDRLDPSGEPSFVCTMIESAVYGSLAPDEVPALHARAARLLWEDRAGAEAVAKQLLSTATSDVDWEVAVLHEAGIAAMQRGNPSLAALYMARALDGRSPDEGSSALLVDLGRAKAAAGETNSLQYINRALPMIRNPIDRAEALYSLGQTLYRYGRYAESAEAFKRGSSLLPDDSKLLSRFVAGTGCAEYFMPPSCRSVPVCSPNDDCSVMLKSPEDLPRLAVHALDAALTIPPIDRAVAMAKTALADDEMLNRETSEGPSVAIALLPLLYGGEFESARFYAEKVVADARNRGGSLAVAEASLMQAMVLYRSGDITSAEIAADESVKLMTYGWHSLAPTALGTLLNCVIERGDTDRALEIAASAERDLASDEAPGVNAFFYLPRARLHLLLEETSAAQADAEAAMVSIRDYGVTNPAMLPWRSLSGVIAAAAGDRARGLELIAEEIALAERFKVAIPKGAALRLQASLEPPPVARKTLETAVRILEPTGARLELAWALADLGVNYRRCGERTASREPLTKALDLAHHCGAAALALRVEDDLVASGARPRRRASSGVEALTPTESRLAKLAASGLSNRSISEAAYVSKGTVAWHMRNIYRKMQVDSRAKLATALEAAERYESMSNTQ